MTEDKFENPDQNSAEEDVIIDPDAALEKVSDALDGVVSGSTPGSNQVPFDEGDEVSNTDSDYDGIPDDLDTHNGPGN